MTTATPSPLSNQTWQQFYERNVIFRQKSMLERLATALKQSFPETRTPKVGALVIVKTRGVVQQWRVSNIKIATGTLVTITFENGEMTVDASWFVVDANSGSLFLQRLGFFGDMALKHTTN